VATDLILQSPPEGPVDFYWLLLSTKSHLLAAAVPKWPGYELPYAHRVMYTEALYRTLLFTYVKYDEAWAKFCATENPRAAFDKNRGA
jgi:hypothetical protein